MLSQHICLHDIPTLSLYLQTVEKALLIEVAVCQLRVQHRMPECNSDMF